MIIVAPVDSLPWRGAVLRQEGHVVVLVGTNVPEAERPGVVRELLTQDERRQWEAQQ